MKILITLLIIFPSLILGPTSQNTKIIFQTFPVDHYISSVKTQLPGSTEYIIWEREEIQIEIHITEMTAKGSNYGLDYTIQKGNFKLEYEMTRDGRMIIKPIKNNNTIFLKGKKLQTHQTYKIYIPKRLQEAN
ncbi:MAG: hypothetical protein AAF573_00855 [Bacteroidota bacterium]